jgi:hypothetical protein
LHDTGYDTPFHPCRLRDQSRLQILCRRPDEHIPARDILHKTLPLFLFVVPFLPDLFHLLVA